LYPYVNEGGYCCVKRTISGETAAKYFGGQQFAYYVSAKDNVALIRDAYIVATKLLKDNKESDNKESDNKESDNKDIATLAAEYATNRVVVNVTTINDYDDVILYAYRLDGVTRFVDDSTLETQYRNMLANKRNANKAGTEARKAAEAQGIVAINGTPEQK
jgi:nucleotide-binding universal stress UspA family protein